MLERTLEEIRNLDTIEVRIDAYSPNGAGRVTLEDGCLQIPEVMPDERVRIEILDERSDAPILEGRPLEILDASEHRRDPLCDRNDICRGCQLRHATVDEELRLKEQFVREAVEAELEPEHLPAIERVTPWPISRGDAFRMHMELTYRRAGDDFELGWSSDQTDVVVPMSTCPALTTATQRLVSYVETALQGLASSPPDRDDELDGDTIGLRSISVVSPTFGRGLIDVQFAGEVEAPLSEQIESTSLATFVDMLLDELPDDVGVVLSASEIQEIVKLPERIDLPLAGLQIEVGHGNWCPTTLKPIEAMYEQALEWLELDDSDRFLDIGCGVGTIALLAASRVEHSTGIDIDRHAVETAELNALYNDTRNVEFIVAGWEKALRRLAFDESRTFEAAVVHPSERPLGERVLAYLQTLDVERLVYIGPDPDAAADDLGELVEQGWTLEALGAANTHPATARTVLMASLTR